MKKVKKWRKMTFFCLFFILFQDSFTSTALAQANQVLQNGVGIAKVPAIFFVFNAPVVAAIILLLLWIVITIFLKKNKLRSKQSKLEKIHNFFPFLIIYPLLVKILNYYFGELFSSRTNVLYAPAEFYMQRSSQPPPTWIDKLFTFLIDPLVLIAMTLLFFWFGIKILIKRNKRDRCVLESKGKDDEKS